MQRLLNAARWQADSVRDALGHYVAAQLGGPAAVLAADETGFRAGRCSAGVHRQYTGTAAPGYPDSNSSSVSPRMLRYGAAARAPART